MNPKRLEESSDPLLAKSYAALLRARKRAEELAIRTNTALVQVIDGKLVRVYPKRGANGDAKAKPDGT